MTSESQSPWSDIVPELVLTTKKLSIIGISDSLCLDQWNGPSSVPLSGFDAFKHSMGRAKHKSVDNTQGYNSVNDIQDVNDSDCSLPDSPTRAVFDDAEFIVENTRQRKSIDNTPTTNKQDTLGAIASLFRTNFLSAKQDAVDKGIEVDWDFWGKLINDYDAVLAKHPRKLQKKLVQGWLPNSLLTQAYHPQSEEWCGN